MNVAQTLVITYFIALSFPKILKPPPSYIMTLLHLFVDHIELTPQISAEI